MLHPRTASKLADLVRIMNTDYSNLIEGHHTRPRDIEQALTGELHQDQKRRDLQPRPKHMYGFRRGGQTLADSRLLDPTSSDFISISIGSFIAMLRNPCCGSKELGASS